MRLHILVAAFLVLGALAVAPFLAMGVLVPRDAAAPVSVRQLLPEAKAYLAGQLDVWPTGLRYTGAELRDTDHLVILQFELRQYPFLTADRAYLFSRCTPLEKLDPRSMGGGRGVTDFATDPELVYARSDAQPPCG
jgi:hypothetical protein